MQTIIIVATLLGGIAALAYFGDRIRRILSSRNSDGASRGRRLKKTEVAALYQKLQKGTATSTGNINLIQRIAQGPPNLSRTLLEEIITKSDFYSMAERDAARLTLEDLDQGRATTGLVERVREMNPNRRLAEQFPCLAAAQIQLVATAVYWDRPESKTFKQAFAYLLGAAKGEP